MTADKQNNGYTAKPFTPTLSAAFHRANKSPLTPKLASPAGYRTPKRLNPADSHSQSASAPRADSESASYLSANVTPRSGSRNSRRDGSLAPSPHTTPSNGQYSPQASYTPTPTAGGPRTERSPNRMGARLEPARSYRAKTWTTDSHLSRPNSSSDLSSGNSPMFFHASDARSSNSDPDPTRLKPHVKPSTPATFVYANGEQERQSGDESAGRAMKRRSSGMSRPGAVAKPPSASPRLASPKLHAAARLSDSFTSQIIPPSDAPADPAPQLHSPPLNFSPKPPAPTIKHTKSPSLDAAPRTMSPREGLRPSPILISPSDAKLDASALSSEPIPGLRPRIFSTESTTSIDAYSAAQSPVKSETNSQPKDEGILNARTERKILDLEISNSSLLAINRTLEREMRKQNAELRRFRRLSRAGRLSMATSTRSVSGTSLGIASELDEASEMSSIRSPEDMSDFSDEESMADEGVMSPDSLAEHDARHRDRDEKRFLIDLTKHQELLADSQKMNQSLRRCLGWTEELIKEGQKALEYSVHVNDIELGGRVLAPEELHDIGESARGLLSPSAIPDVPPDEPIDEPTETA
ncbi:hypothetical protein ATEIFO6365_0010021800 [Aspergillus terreus]|uniref:Uncharacterized protein n=1 Tax=Aspergillus terreus TaxID=33178 RepID=A0A5M3ZDA0_ASPTE|nr:hypothetical protein ATETN484_0012019700 [Aspergillus terreus]GFF19445.1 hypothetical protein ATEIFO6365_0010021800 [Aspergillus terreus]